MRAPYQEALLCAIFLLALFTLDSKALSRVDHRGGYRPTANVTSFTQPQQKQWQPQQQNPYGIQPPSYATTTRSPSQQSWNNPGGNYNNQWNAYNQSAISGLVKPNWNGYNQTANQWQQRYNNTPGGQLPSWNVPLQRPFQSNQSHIYPNLPNGGRQPLPTPARFNNQWNQTRLPPAQQYPGGAVGPNQGNNNWWANQNKTWTVQTTTPLPYLRPNSNVNIGGGGGGGPNNNWWNHTRGGNTNTGWGTPSGTGIASPNGSNASYPQGQVTWANGWGGSNTGQNTNNPAVGWGGSNAGQNNLAGWGSNSGQNGLPSSNAQNGWQGGAAGSSSGSHNGLNNNNWQNTGQSGSGAQLAPLGGNAVVSSGGQPYNPSNSAGGIPLAPLGGSNSQPGWHSASAQQNPNAWNHGSTGSNSAQLAPLAPLSYGGGGGSGGSNAVNSNRANGGAGSYPYTNMFN